MERQFTQPIMAKDGGDEHLPSEQILLRYLLAHGLYEMAILKMEGQYVLYCRVGQEVRVKPISAESVRGAFAGEPVDSGWLVEGVKRWGSGPSGTFMVKYAPPGIGTIYLTLDGKKGPSACKLPLPGLVFAGVNGGAGALQDEVGGTSYYIWALQEEQFHPSAKLYHAPFPNVYSDGRICFGDVHVPEVSWKTIDKAWSLFLESRFTLSMVSGKSVRHSDDVRKMLLACQTLSCYPAEDLLPLRERRGQGYANSGSAVETVNDAVEVYLLGGKEQA